MPSIFWSIDAEEVNANMKDISEAYIVSRPIIEAGTLRILTELEWCEGHVWSLSILLYSIYDAAGCPPAGRHR
jgi:hypothetical protein